MDLRVWYQSTRAVIEQQTGLTISGPRQGHTEVSAVHLAVFVEPFLTFVMDGSKRIDSRFSTNKTPPFGSVFEGDLLLIKESSGPIVAATIVNKVWSYGSLTSRTSCEIHERFGQDIRDDVPGFWDQRARARYITLVGLSEIKRLKHPIQCPKNDRRGWVILQSKSYQQELFPR